MKNVFDQSLVLGWLFSFAFSLQAQAAEGSSANLLEQGSAAYSKGDCETAINKLQGALNQKNLGESDEAQAQFKIAYCHFSQDKYSTAETEFKNYLKRHPENDEAHLKLAQSQLYQNKYDEAKGEALKVKQEEFKLAATIVLARVQLGKEQPQQAQEILRPATQGDKASAEALYWMGVAQYNNDQDDAALASFQRAQKLSNQNYWVFGDSKSWIDRLQSESQKFHFLLTLGWLEDSNIGQSGSSVNLIPGQPPSQGKPSAANTNADRGPYASIDLTYNIWTSRKHYFATTLSESSPFYQSNSSYNNESFGWNLAYAYSANNQTTYGIDLKYLESRYNNTYYQDYALGTPYASWSLSSDFWMKASLPLNYYLRGKNILLTTPTLDARYDVNSWVSLYGGLSYTKSAAPSVTIAPGNPPSVTSGTLATHYATTTYYIGAGVHLPYALELGVTGTSATTQYDAEPLPPSSDSPSARKDVLKTMNISLTESWIKNVFTSTVSLTTYDNKSTGFQGFPSSGSLSDNSYTRNYLLISASYYY